MAKIPHVAVIILSWNGKKDVLETIQSLKKSNQTGFKMEIFLIDNGSADGTPEDAEKLNIKVRKLTKN